MHIGTEEPWGLLRSEDTVWELVLSFYNLGPKGQTQEVIRVSDKCLYQQSHLAVPTPTILKFNITEHSFTLCQNSILKH